MQETEEYNHLTTVHQRLKEPDTAPYDLDEINKFHLPFDVLKKAIEYLGKQQREQQTIIVDLIESIKERKPVTEFRSEPGEPQVVEKVIERLPDTYEKPKDYGPLL